MTSLMGRLVDKANIVRASFSDLEKAVIKATRHNLKGPKEKHVRRLIVSTFEQPGKNQELITLLAKRLEIVDWITVMKTLEVFHRLLRDGNASFINDLKYKSNIFNLRSFKDITTPEAHYQSIFIQKYSQYIEEKVLVFKMLSVEFERDPNVTKTFSVDDAFEKVPRLQSQLNALLNCRASKNHINNPIIVYGFTLLLKDSFKLYRALNDSIINLLEHYFSMGKANAAKALEIYKLFTKETDGIIQFFDITRKFSKNDLPELQHAPTTLVEALENYLKDIEEGKTGSSSSNERGKKLVQQFQDFRFDDASFQQDTPVHDEDSDSDDDTPHSKPPPQIPRNTANNTAPSFDPFSFDDASASTDALPTFGSSNNQNTNAFFDDPFAPPKPVANNPNQFNDKKKQIEAVMTTAAYGAPLQPQPMANSNSNGNNNFFGTGGFSSGPNYNSPFGPTPVNNNNSNPFGFPQNNQPNNNFGGFPNNNQQQQQQQQQFGFPQNNNQGFNNQGFGFGQQQQQPVNNNPFGNTNPFLTNNPPPSNNTNNFNPFA